MSAPKSGQQSPPPERQTGAQQQDVPSKGKISEEYKPDPEAAKRESEGARNTLQSNPEHPFEKAEEARKQR